jgi:MOSC domain-containing protein YiiM
VAHVVSITLKPADGEPRPAERFARVGVTRAELVAGFGLAGDAKGRADSRQLNLMLAETVAELRAEGFRTEPGELGEGLIVAGLTTDIVVPGARLRIGAAAVVELVYPRVPCGRFARVHGRAKDAARGRLGFMARVLVGGMIAVGDSVEAIEVGDVL